MTCVHEQSIFLPEGLDSQEIKREPNKEDQHPFICNLFYIFFLPFVCRIRPVTKEDIYQVAKEDRTEENAMKVSAGWDKSVKKYIKEIQHYISIKETDSKSTIKEPDKPSLMNTLIFQLGDFKLVLAVVFMLVACGISLAQPYLMEKMLEIVDERQEAEESGEQEPGFPYVSGLILIICPFANSIFTSLGMRYAIHFVARVRASLACLIFDSTIKSSIGGETSEEKGQLLSLLSSDVATVSDMTLQAFYMIQLPFRMIVAFIFVVISFGVVSLVAIAVFAISIPFQFISASVLMKAMRQYMLINDERNKATNELLQGVRLVKCNGLEGLFVKRIESIRERQLPSIFSITTFHQLYMSVMHTVPHYLAVASFASYIAAQKVPQERFAVEVMPTVEYLELMAEPAVNLPMYLQAAMMAVVSFRRIRDFLSVDTSRNKLNENDEKDSNKEIDSDLAVSVKGCHFGWEYSKSNFQPPETKEEAKLKEINHPEISSSSQTSQQSYKFNWKQKCRCILRGINFNIKRGSLSIVVGSVGSGKSSIGLALIGEMKRMKGSIKVNGSVAYCPQNAWITSNSVRGNILFGNSYNESRYKQTIKVCGLEKDLSILPAGDETAVGERGVNMSGGQKARIQLARAVYSDRDIYILDDPLSAVDAYVGQKLFQECIDGQLKGKTRILLSNGILEHHAQRADQIIILEKGQIIAQGTLEEIETQGIDISKYMRNNQYDFIMNQNQLIKSPDIHQQDKNNNPDKHALHHKHVHIVASTDIPPPPPMQNIESTSQEENQQTKTPENSQSNGYHLRRAQSQSSISTVDTQISISSFGAISPSPRLSSQSKLLSNNQFNINSPQQISMNEKISHQQQLQNEIGDKEEISFIDYNTDNQDLKHFTQYNDQQKSQIRNVGKRVLTGEEQATGAIPIRAYIDYARSLAPYLIVFLLLILSASAEAMCLVADYWVGVIGEVKQYSNISYWMKIGIYCIMSTYVLFAMLSRSIIGGYLVKRSSRRVHGKLLSSVSKAPSSFYDTTPLGRIINRFTGDLPLIDRELYNTIIHVLNMWFSSISAVIVIAVDTALFLAFGIPVLLLLFIILTVYLRAARNLMRLELMARSPVLSLYNEMTSGAGLPTIRSYGMQQQWRKEFVSLNDEWTIRSILSHEGNLWASIMTGGLTTLFTASVIFLGWMSMSPAKLGVAIGASFRFFELGTHLVEETVQMETRMTSYQRVHFYSNSLPHEIALDDEEYELEDKNRKKKINKKQKEIKYQKGKPQNPRKKQRKLIELQKLNETGMWQGKKWPVGSIRFENVYFRYRPGLPFVLRNISLNISNGERIGVCGRTGAGKSSLCFPLFRLIELNPALLPASIDVETGFPKEDEEDINDNIIDQKSVEMHSQNDSHIHIRKHKDLNKGRVLIDGVDISKVDLYKLRSCLALIPQDPILFAGSIRTNLDVNSAAISELNQGKQVDNFTMIQMKEDNELWEALKLVHLFSTITELPLKLDTQVTDGGSNFSAGQRQQICLARAILSNSSIIVLDEATSCIDAETDRKIQRTIRKQFRGKTVITIAHRLETMQECDRVVVIDEGRIIEVGTPEQLQANPNSAFSRLAKSLEG